MSRTFTAGSSTHIDTTAGGMNTAWTFGSVAVILRRGTLSTGVSYQTILSSELTGAVIGFDFAFNTGDNLVLLAGGVTSSTNINTWTSTTDWMFILVSKATGSVAPVFHVFNYTTGAWSHITGDVAQADMAATATINFHLGAYLTIADYFTGDIEMAGVYKGWVPSNNEVEQAGLHLSKLAWIDVTSRATNFWVARLDQANSGDPVYDLTGFGGNQSAVSATVPPVGGAPALFGYGAPYIASTQQAAAVAAARPSPRNLYKPALYRAAVW